jgi:DNA modification methylase
MIQVNCIDTINDTLSHFIDRYAKKSIPIEVSFRELLPKLNNPDRFSHLIHPYPAKLLMHIPFFFLNNNIFSQPGDNVLDPFCGSGTVLLEANLADRNSFGADSNPLARLISRVKTNRYDEEKLYFIFENLYTKSISNDIFPQVVNLDYWFLPNIKSQLLQIYNAIMGIDEKDYKDFFLVCFSNCVRKVSLADPRVSVPVRIKIDHYPPNHPFRKKNKEILKALKELDVKEKFAEIFRENVKRIKNLNLIDSDKTSKIVSNDAKHLITPENSKYPGLCKKSIDLIITSPPYSGAQKYIRSSSLNLGWTGLANIIELRELDSSSIGRESYKTNEHKKFLPTDIPDADKILYKVFKINPLRAHIAGNYILEMKNALAESYKVLKKNGIFVIVAANNHVCKNEFHTQEYLQNILENMGAKVILRLVDDIKSYGLMTKRNKSANIITREWILVFQKMN